jgi:hypothetical protein
MNWKTVKTGLGIFLIICIAGCSAIEVRSPIVNHTGKKTSDESAAVTSAQASVPEPAPSAENKEGSSSPADINIYSAQELSSKQLASLGQITVKAADKKGFTAEEAMKELKIMAFKRYGSLAQGIAKIEYMESSGLFAGDKNTFRQASAEVMTSSAITDKQSPGTEAAQESREAIPPLDKIAVVSSAELYNLSFKMLGTVRARDTTPQGMNREQAIKSLKIEAYRLYGSRAKGLTNIKLKKEDPIYFYKKPRYSPPPKAQEGYSRAVAEVVFWP